MKPGDNSSLDPDTIATQWIARRDRGLSPRETVELVEWLEQPAHAEAFARCEAAWQALPSLKQLPREKLAALMAPRRRRRAPVLWLSAAVAAAAAVALFFLFPRSGSLPLATPVIQAYQAPAHAEARVELPDGSVAILQRGSRIAFGSFSAGRQVRLLAGEAHFTVAKTTPAPFFVRAGPVVVRDIGTAFDVKLDSDRVAVLVTEGSVVVSSVALPEASLDDRPQVLTLGQKAVVETNLSLSSVMVTAPTPAEMEQDLAWKSSRLSFDRTSLRDAVTELNRYNVRQLVIVDSAVSSILIAGGVSADNLDAFVRLLDSGFGVTAEFREREILLRKAR